MLFWGLMERVKMLLKVLPGLSLLPRMPRVDPCQLQVLLRAVTHSLHAWVQPGGAAAPKHSTKFGPRPSVDSLLLGIHGDLVAGLCGAGIHSSTRGKLGLSQLLLSLPTPLVHKHGENRDLGQGQAALWLGRCCTTSLFPHFHRLRESQEGLGWKGPHSPSRAIPCHAQGHFL